MKARSQVSSDRARLAIADRASVELANPDDFTGCAGEKGLIRSIEVVAIQDGFNHLVTSLSSELHDSITGHAAQYARIRRRCGDPTLFYDEHILARSFRDSAGAVEHE